MDLYLLPLVVGSGGLISMALLGLSGGGHHAPKESVGPSLHGHAPATLHSGSHAPAHHGGHHGDHNVGHHSHHHGDRDGRGSGALLGLLSPRVFFSLLLGFGAAGVILRSLIPWPLLLLAVSLGAAVIFERAVIHPLWSFLLNFATQPAKMLNHLLLQEAEAASDFDRSGHGLVRVELDGQTRQILGKLCSTEQASGIRVRTGDRLFIRDVDEERNSCTVSMLSC